MAGDWIKMRNNLWDDPRVSRLCDLTDQSEAAVIGGLYWLWAAADEHTEDGHMPGLSLRGIDRKTGVSGLGKALETIGWVKEIDGGLEIVRFDEHNGASAKRRTMEAQRKANARTVSASNADKSRTETGHHAELEKRREDSSNSKELLVDSGADDEPPPPVDTPKKDNCKHQEIIALYHKHLPANPRIRDWTSGRAEQLRARWNESKERQNLEYWEGFFQTIAAKCPFLVGQKTGSNGRPFLPGLDWLVKAENFAKIREGRYLQEEAA